jgi:radical SAM superfamily enzyme YgiQ (UPF0313 family)
MYKDKIFRIRSMEDILEDIELAKEYYGDIEKIFLGDGDALTMPAENLTEILDCLYATFPGIFYVGTYASPRSILKKTPLELQHLREHGLVEIHLGVESGDDSILRDIRKGVTYNEMVTAGKKVRDAGIQLFVTVILGLAGKMPATLSHAENTARICNEIQPDYIGVLTIMAQPRTELYKKLQDGKFQLPEDKETLEEMLAIIQRLELNNCGITSIHPSNCLHLDGVLPQDKERLLQILTGAIDGTDPVPPRPRDLPKV